MSSNRNDSANRNQNGNSNGSLKPGAAAFTTSDGLRRLLTRLHDDGPSAWAQDSDAADLMRFVVSKYAALARKHRQEPDDAASAAFEVMRTNAARTAADPWAVVTRAVQLTLRAEERAHGLLCSTDRARRMAGDGFHDAERFSDRETPIHEFHPAFRAAGNHAGPDTHSAFAAAGEEEAPTNAYDALDLVVEMFVVLGWPRDTAKATCDYIAARLVEAGSRSNAHEVLRRDHHARALLDLDRRSWATVLRVVLGTPNKDLAHTEVGRGMLLRLLIDERPFELMQDDQLVRAIHDSAPDSSGSACA